MALFFKFAIGMAVGLLLVSGLVSVLSALFSRISAEPCAETGDIFDDAHEYDGVDGFSNARDGAGAT